ncbi:transcriptional repressor general negative regulator of transcription subunit 4, partial [Coemansia sp. RSA 25]
TLRSHDYFGQFGRINKIVINRRQNGGGGNSSAQHPSVGVYVTYATKEEATRAINAVDGSLLDGRVLRATFGTTKYCSYYLRSISCQNPGCMYLHEPGEEADSFTKEDLAANRAELRDVPREAFDHEDDYPAGRAVSRSPTTHQGAGRAVVPSSAAAASVSSLPGFQNNRPHSTVSTAAPTAAAASAAASTPLSMTVTNAASRLRKASELSGLRPKSVEPHGNDADGGTGSALPATASWATRAMAKKPVNEPPEPKSRRPESGGTMTLRMIPASRNKTAAASSTTAKPSSAATAAIPAAMASMSNTSPTTPSASSATTRERAKTASASTAAATAMPAATPDAAAALASAAGIPHHPALQQLSRERKQQQRHQTRAQQKQAKQIDAEDVDGDGDTETDIDFDAETSKKRRSAASKAASKAAATLARGASTSMEAPSQLQRGAEQVNAAVRDIQETNAADMAATSETLVPAASSEIAPEPPVFAASAEPIQLHTDAVVTADHSRDAVVPDAFALQAERHECSAAGYEAAHGANHTNSALSFQSITDSLFAQLNAKVSTPPTSNLPAFSGPGSSGGAAAFDGHGGGIRSTAGYPAVDPLLFPPMGMVGNDMGPSGYGRMDGAPPQFNAFGGPPNSAQWGRLGMVPGGYAPTPLSSVLAGPPSLGPPPLGSLGEAAPPPGGLGAFSRQRSRWDFVHADEASAQAELQSVLGRGGPADKDVHIQHQQGPPPGSFMSSRDLGMFSTPVQNDYSGRPWGSRQQVGDAYSVPHPPPGFGGRQRSDLLRGAAAEPSALPMLGSGTPPGGSNTLLSRLTGQAGSAGGHDVAGVSAESGLPVSHYSLAQAQQFHGYHDPAIHSSYAAAAPPSMNSMQAMASNASMGNMQQAASQQQQQYARGRGDPNVLNSLLARLHLGGQGEGASPLAAAMTSSSQPGPASMPSMSQPPMGGHRGSIGAGGGMAPPGIGPMGMAGSPVYNSSNALGQNRMPLAGLHGMSNNAGGGGGFVDPAIMNMGRINVGGGGGSGSGGPTSPVVGLPPGILSPQSADSGGGGGGGNRHAGQMQSAMVSRSANSSGRSRFLNHFSPDGAGAGAASKDGSNNAPQHPVAHPGGGSSSSTQSPAGERSGEGELEAGMVNGVPPGLPTTGLFGELLRRVKLEAAAASAAGGSGGGGGGASA